MKKSEQVRQMFDRIAGKYDLLNHILSFGVDFYWRKVALNTLDLRGDWRVLDLCVGTGNMALGTLRQRNPPAFVIGVDLSREMLTRGQSKVINSRHGDRIKLVRGDAEWLPFRDDQFDGVTVGFGVRNMADPDRGLEEIRRVLKSGGKAVMLEFSKPKVALIRSVYFFYLKHLVPLIGGLISGNYKDYRDLYDSEVSFNFTEGRSFLERMERERFIGLREKPLTFGVATVYSGAKSGS